MALSYYHDSTASTDDTTDIPTTYDQFRGNKTEAKSNIKEKGEKTKTKRKASYQTDMRPREGSKEEGWKCYLALFFSTARQTVTKKPPSINANNDQPSVSMIIPP